MTVTPGNVSQAGVNGSTTASWSHTVAAGTDRVLYVALPHYSLGLSAPPATSVTFGGAPLRLVGYSAVAAGGDRAEVWALTAPPAVTATVAVAFADAQIGVYGAVDLQEVQQASPEGFPAGATGTGTGPSVTLAAEPDGLVVDALAADGSPVAVVTAGAGQTVLWNAETGNERGAAARAAGAASVTTAWTLDASASWAQVAVPVRPNTAPELLHTPSLVGVGAIATAASGPVTPALPAGTQDGDVLLLLAQSEDNVAHDPGDEWTQLDQGNNTTGQRTSLWWLRRGPAAPSAPTVAHAAGSGMGAVVQAWRGVRLAGDPQRASSRRTGTGSTLPATTALTGLAVQDAVVALVAFASDAANMDAPGDWVAPANGVQTGSGQGLYTRWQTQPADGTSDAPVFHLSGAGAAAAAATAYLVALVPEPLAPTVPPAAAAPPVTVSTSSLWPDQANARVGPYEAADGALYVFAVDRVYTRVRAFRSGDAGGSWAQADAAHAPPCAAAAGYRVLDGDASADGATVYLLNTLSATALNVLRFDLTAGAWLEPLAGPTVAFSATAVGVGQPAVGPRAFLARGTAAGADYLCLLYNGADETVSAAPRLRVKLHQYAVGTGAWTGPYDVHGSANTPPANTLPGTTVAYAAAGCVRGAGARVHLLYQDGTALDLRCRTWTCAATGAFAAGAVCAGADDVGVQGTGTPTAYAAAGGSATGVAVPYTRWGGAACAVARCADDAGTATAGNWTQEAATAFAGEGATAGALATPGALTADPSGARLWWLVTTEDQAVAATDDAGGGWWTEPQAWKEGDDVVCGGLSLLPLADGSGVGVLYADQNGTPALAQTGYDQDVPLGAANASGHARAQSFSVTAAVTLRTARFRLRRVGTRTGNLSVIVRTSSGGLPSATVRGATAAKAIAALPVNDAWVTFTGLNAQLTPGVTYWLVLQPPTTADASNYVVAQGASTDVAAGGQQANGTMATTPVWTAVPGADLAYQGFTSEFPPRLRYDRILVLLPSALRAVGTATSPWADLGVRPPPWVGVLLDVGAGADPAGTVAAVLQGSAADPAGPGGPATQDLATYGPYGVQMRDTVGLTNPPRWLRMVVTTTGAASASGVSIV